jgi:type II secretory pathway component GspD/PulD (secretin)
VSQTDLLLGVVLALAATACSSPPEREPSPARATAPLQRPVEVSTRPDGKVWIRIENATLREFAEELGRAVNVKIEVDAALADERITISEHQDFPASPWLEWVALIAKMARAQMEVGADGRWCRLTKA